MLNINQIKRFAPCFLLSLFATSVYAQSSAPKGSPVGSAIVNPVVSTQVAPQAGTILASSLQSFNIAASNSYPQLMMNTHGVRCPASTIPTVMTSIVEILPMSSGNTYPNLAINVVRAQPVGAVTWNGSSYATTMSFYGSSSAINGGVSPAYINVVVDWILFCLASH